MADVVKNLAMRAADAAKTTSPLIEGTVKKINDGSELVTGTNETFGKVKSSAYKVKELGRRNCRPRLIKKDTRIFSLRPLLEFTIELFCALWADGVAELDL